MEQEQEQEILPTKRGELLKISVLNLEEDTEIFNRFSLGSEEMEIQLMMDIVENGVVRPFSGRKKSPDSNIYIIYDGHRRLHAILRAFKEGLLNPDLFRVPLIPMRKLSATDTVLNMLSSNNGKPFTAIEKAKHFRFLKDHGLTISEIAKKTGNQSAVISSIINLAYFSNKVYDVINNGTIGYSIVLQLLNENKGDYDVTEQAIFDKLNQKVENATIIAQNPDASNPEVIEAVKENIKLRKKDFEQPKQVETKSEPESETEVYNSDDDNFEGYNPEEHETAETVKPSKKVVTEKQPTGEVFTVKQVTDILNRDRENIKMIIDNSDLSDQIDLIGLPKFSKTQIETTL